MAIHAAGHDYLPKSDHRDGTTNKSQWTISEAEEVAAFSGAIAAGWTSGQLAWGLHLRDGRASYLGHSALVPGPTVALFLALFEISCVCHGYPADHVRSNREKPPVTVQRAWLDSKYLRPQVIKKIARGKRCKL